MTTTAELRRLLAEATPGPFYYGIAYSPDCGSVSFDYQSPGYYNNTGILSSAGVTVVGCGEYNVFSSPADAALIVAAVNSLPALLDRIERLERNIEQIGGIDVEAGRDSDNLAIVLCTYFEAHIESPINDEKTEHGWGVWASMKADAALLLLRAALNPTADGSKT